MERDFLNRIFSRALLLVVLLCMNLFFACGNIGNNAESSAEKVFTEAFDALQNHDYDLYMKSLDFGTDMDSIQLSIMKDAVMQHQAWKERRCGTVADMQVVDATLNEDSTCTVYYHVIYVDSTKENSSQLMSRRSGEWKIRVRN